MLISSISNSKLHGCLVALILFILIFLSLPLLLIYLANTRYEDAVRISETCENQRTQINNSTINQNQSEAGLSLADENFRCPTGTFPCQSCPDICIEQRRICDGNADCLDRSDESSCHDSNGALMSMFQNIVAKKNSSSAYAQPDSCTIEQFLIEQCPCNYTDPLVVICDSVGLKSVPAGILWTVYKIRLDNNSIISIDNVSWPKNLSSIVLAYNPITHISRSTFKLAPKLSKLYLDHNEISYIDSEAFTGLSNLTTLHLEVNKLRTFDSQMLIHTPAITRIYLSENMIDLPESTRFSYGKNIKELLLDHNRISSIRSHWFSNMTSLKWLSLTYNEISLIEPESFNLNNELEELNLSYNKIKFIDRYIFARGLKIEKLDLGENPLQPLPVDAFLEIIHLKSLNLTNVYFDYINRETFINLTELEFIYFAKFRYCHYANHVRVCRPLTDGLSSAKELLALPILKYAVWIVASVCSLGNVFVFIWRSVSPHEDRTLSLFVRNLSIADLMMGIYLGAIGWQDWHFKHNFGQYAIDWMSSWTCTAIGFLAILSSELSVFILTIITIERYRSIISINRFEEEAQKRRARIYVLLAWLFSFLIAFYPLVEWILRNSDYYATNGLCLPLHIDQPFSRGWQYSAFIYLGINFSAVMVIIALYVHMYSMIINGRQVSRPVLFKAEKREDAILAIRFFFIVITDCLCWIPIVVIKIMALANVSISSSIYGWLVVFIIPINSALNPIVYTLAAPTTLRAAVCRLFERICYKVDLITAGGSNYSSQTSSGGSSNLDAHSISKISRKKTGSNSTTYDTVDASIISNSKASVESALINHDLQFSTINTSDIQSNTNASKFSSSNTMIIEDSVNDEYKLKFNNIKFFQRYDMTVGGGQKSNRPYDYLSTYEDNAIKHKIIHDQTTVDYNCGQQLATYRDLRIGRQLAAYESLERRTSFDGRGKIADYHCNNEFIKRFNVKRYTNSRRYESEDDIQQRGKVVMQMVDAKKSGSEESTTKQATGNKEKSYVFSNGMTSDVRFNANNKIDMDNPQVATSGQNRVSFSSRDSRTCLLSQNDSC